MASDFALQPLLDLAGRRLEAATAELQRLAALRQQAEDSLAQLQSRQAEYLTGLQRALARGIEPDRLRDYRAFLSRLERAIGLQSEELERRRRAWAEAHARWLELRRRERALAVLEQRHHRAEAVREGRREQRRQDELTVRKAGHEALEDASLKGTLPG
jgi:flagellar FliJ protein